MLLAFVIVLALTLKLGFVAGDIADVSHHNVYGLYAAVVVSLITTLMKFGDRSALGSTMLATRLVADLQLIAAAAAWGLYSVASGEALNAHQSATVISLAIDALVANVVSVLLRREQQRRLLPTEDTVPLDGEHLLFSGRAQTRSYMRFRVASQTLPQLDTLETSTALKAQ